MTDWLDEEVEGDNYFPKKEKGIDIPDFINKGEILPTEEQLMAQAMLNNVPGNTDIEKANHLAELERACQNWDGDEWSAVIGHADALEMLDEVKRRIDMYQQFIANNRNNISLLASQKL